MLCNRLVRLKIYPTLHTHSGTMGLVVQTWSSKMASQQKVLFRIPTVTQSKSYIISLTECVPANPEIILWDTPRPAL